jgi:RNA polymerase sigma factor (sigma-70 family)
VHDPAIQQLTAAISSGDTEAFGRFYGQWFDYMYDHARRATGLDESACLDIVQEAMMRVIRSMPEMRNEPALRAWLRTVVQSRACDYLRAKARRRRREAQRDASSAEAEPNGIGDLEDRLVWLRRELSQLDPDGAHLLTMRHRFGWTLKQIGAAVGLSPSAVDGRLGRLTETLRRRAAEPTEEGAE